jgi:hypothetical protein
VISRRSTFTSTPATGPEVGRREFLLAFLLLPAPDRDVAVLFALLAEDLGGNDAEQFLSRFDPNMPGYRVLAENVRALVVEGDVTSSVEIASDEGDADTRRVEADWLMEITLGGVGNPVERRHAKIRCTLRRSGKRWLVSELDPISFFRAP